MNTIGYRCLLRFKPVAVAALLWSLLLGSVCGVLSVQNARAQGDDTSPVDRASAARNVPNRPSKAKELALKFHRNASQIDKLPSFLIRAKAGTREFSPVADPSPQPLANLVRALDAPVVEKDWYRYEATFAWDPQRFIHRSYHPGAKDSSDDPPMRFTKWGTADVGGQHSRSGERPATHVLRSSAKEMWKDNTVSNPNYLLATTHKFWWGDNSYRHQCFSSIPPAMAEYRQLEEEEFDGETCNVIESPTRQERLWLSQESGRLRGYLQLSYHGLSDDFFKSPVVQEVAGKTFSTRRDYAAWYRSEYEKLPREKQLKLILASREMQDFATARPSLLVRFRDYREISPGIWWPFQEDRAQGFPSDEGYQCMRSTYRVQEVRTPADLEATVRDLQPKEGEMVQDQRFGLPINYKYKKGRTKEELLSMASAEQQERQNDKRRVAQLKQPYQELVGKPAPKLPDETWIGGEPPNLTGHPYLIHFWAVWCGPCKNDYPLLNRMAENGATIIGLHPSGTDRSDVKKAIEDANLGYPTLLDSDAGTTDDSEQIASYPASMFPYCVLVDANGLVVDHGFLGEDNRKLISKLRELREQTEVE